MMELCLEMHADLLRYCIPSTMEIISPAKPGKFSWSSGMPQATPSSELSGSCAKQSIRAEVPNSVDDCYLLKTGATTAISAERGCNMDGSHLASIHDKNMNDFMRRTAVGNGYLTGMHIGLAKLDYLHYSWTDKSPVGYTNFGTNQPDDSKGSCVKMTTDTVEAPWMSEDCASLSLPYFCTKKAVILTDAPQPAECATNAHYKAGDHIYSPSFPAPGGSSFCNYSIGETDITKKVQLEIIFFESNQCCDSLSIFDTDGSELMTLRGYKGPTALYVKATGNTLTLKWNATSGMGVRGFHAIASNY
ncbi:hypothetical protein PENTCL1PPCAC_12326 [Pristionchus entomophagus]|uniref:CUB domain-containing protein n=1 Tax=Pristionchus entomophagus TaxID=358040 RepID=A0AAV5T3Q9_9BILA|nr:hypothetical protein PENTCL1PPCAC_12326 [Pristionchus entomophagus]